MVKWTATTFVVGLITYASYARLNKFVNETKFYFSGSEDNFVPKGHAFDLKVVYERNGRNNVETFVNSYSDNLPVYIRGHGIMVGSADYNFSNFSSEERLRFCNSESGIEKKISVNNKNNPKKRLLNAILDLVGD